MTLLSHVSVADIKHLHRAVATDKLQPMSATKEEIARRLGEAFAEMGIADERGRPQKVADKFKVSRETARKWLAGETVPETWRISEISALSGLSFDYIMTGAPQSGLSEAKPKGYSGVEEGPELVTKLPLISWVQAGAWQNIADPYEPGVAEKWVSVPRRYSRRAYCLRVRGDSMQSAEGMSFPDGSIICVEPELAPEHKRFVIVRLEDTLEATFKQLIIDGSEQYLKPLNPRYPIMRIDRPATFCGVVRQMVLDLD